MKIRKSKSQALAAAKAGKSKVANTSRTTHSQRRRDVRFTPPNWLHYADQRKGA
jgi:hypothetical protein